MIVSSGWNRDTEIKVFQKKSVIPVEKQNPVLHFSPAQEMSYYTVYNPL